ncbi:hypothetical protein M0R19_05335 [Candidatus Pacearchaeota archaeon]|jgi:hypothetical protein|nr:hypothetical protein [Candidatus Pacearchaeota archaeon]
MNNDCLEWLACRLDLKNKTFTVDRSIMVSKEWSKKHEHELFFINSKMIKTILWPFHYNELIDNKIQIEVEVKK